MSYFGYTSKRGLIGAGGANARMKAAMQKGAAISAKAARARKYAAIRNSITPSMMASRAQLNALGLGRSSIPPELKGMDTVLTTGPIVATTTTNANAIVLNLVQQGAGSWNRVGRKIVSQSLRLKGCARCFYDCEDATLNQKVAPLRMVVVLDRQTNSGAIPTFETIFGITDQTGAETSTVWSPIRYDATDRFRVLKDCLLEIDGYNLIQGGTENEMEIDIPFDEYIRLPNIETLYSGQSSPLTNADIASGSIYVYFRSSINETYFNWSITSSSFARLRYRD